MQTLFPSRPRWRGWEGGGEGYWRKVSLEEQDSFLHPFPPPPLDPPMWQVEPTSALFSQAARGNDCGAARCLMKVETLVIIIVFIRLVVAVFAPISESVAEISPHCMWKAFCSSLVILQDFKCFSYTHPWASASFHHLSDREYVPTCLWVFSLPHTDSFCLWLAVLTFRPSRTVVVLVGLNKQFSPRLNDRNGLGMRLQGFFSVPWCWSRLHHRAGHTLRLMWCLP